MTTRLFIFTLTLLTSVIFSQTNFKYKNLNDSIFVIGDKIIAPDIIFLNGHASIYPVFRDSVKLIADFLIKHPQFKIELGSHTDSRGETKNNLKYSYVKARYIKNYLIQAHNIDSLRIRIKGYGSSKLLFSDSTIKSRKTKLEKEELHQKNRRIELMILETH